MSRSVITPSNSSSSATGTNPKSPSRISCAASSIVASGADCLDIRAHYFADFLHADFLVNKISGLDKLQTNSVFRVKGCGKITERRTGKVK
jgi:hypothetical protein